MRSISGIENDRTDNARGILRRALSLMAHDDGVYPHCLDSIKRIPQTFALDDAARTRRNIYDIRAKILTGELKRSARTRARLIEECYDGFSAQRGNLLDISVNNVFHLFGCFEHEMDFLRTEILQAENIASTQGHGAFLQADHSFVENGRHHISCAHPDSLCGCSALTL